MARFTERGWRLVTHSAAASVLLALSAMPVYSTASVYSEVEEEGVIYPSNNYIKRLEAERESVTPDDAEKIRFRPLGNNPMVDPMSKAYQSWIEEYRGGDVDPANVDASYEAFVEEASPLLFSMGFKRLHPDIQDLIEAIPPDAFPPIGNKFDPLGPLDVQRSADPIDPFVAAAPAEESVLGPDIGLNIEMREPEVYVDKMLNMAYDALMVGQFEGAIATYREIVNRQPDHKEALFGLGTALYRNGQQDEARDAYLEILKLDPNHWPALNNLMVHAGEDTPQDALRELQRLEMINPEFSPIAAQIGIIYLRLNQLDNAIKYLTRAALISPENMAYRYNLAVVLDHGGYKRQAARMYKLLLDANEKGYELPESRAKIADRLTFISTLKQVAE